jgi:aspartyl-tRNA(Asn)/glutamyl-tRNA(Gln) amidotransferase subunit A
VTTKLRDGGAIILGKGNCDEFAMGSSGENSGYGPTKNSIDPTRVPGGSSSGPAVAVAAGWVPVSIGTDTGGSVRQPASFCGLVGLRPTYGRVSRSGVIAMSSSLDQISPFTNSVADAARMLEGLAGPDPLDQTTVQWRDDLVDLGADIESKAADRLAGLRIASFDGPPELEGLDPVVKALIVDKRAAFVSAIQATPLTSFESIVGETVARNFLDLTLDAYYILMPAEVSSNLARYDGIRFGIHSQASTLLDQYLESRSAGFGPEAKRRIMLGTHVLSSGYYDAYYKTALQARAYIQQKFDEVFKQVDILMCPVAPTTAFKLGEKTENPLAMYLADIYSIPSNIGGLCAISVPGGDLAGLPVGMQLIAKGGDERRLLQVAAAFERFME